MTSLRSVKGMHDILPVDAPRWRSVEETYRKTVSLYGFEEIRTPILEPLDLFRRGIGETTDIVEKEMYCFTDKGGESLALRPEGTASVVRAYIQHNMTRDAATSRLYYIGPMFRRERPARGRYRQFYQAGAELLGVSEPGSDAELIDMAFRFLDCIGVTGLSVQVNTLGDSDTREQFRNALIACFSRYAGSLCEDCLRRIHSNPLRVLDCKNVSCQHVCEAAPSVQDYLTTDAKVHFDGVRSALDLYKRPYQVAPRLVRGLDYYNRTVFEIQSSSADLGAQTTIVGGGRYDGLIQSLGGRPTPTVGFAFGVERILMLLDNSDGERTSKRVFVVGIGEGWYQRTIELAQRLRDNAISVETIYAQSGLRAQLKRANKSGACLVLISGEDEASEGSVLVRDMRTGEQEMVSVDNLVRRVGEML